MHDAVPLKTLRPVNAAERDLAVLASEEGFELAAQFAGVLRTSQYREKAVRAVVNAFLFLILSVRGREGAFLRSPIFDQRSAVRSWDVVKRQEFLAERD